MTLKIICAQKFLGEKNLISSISLTVDMRCKYLIKKWESKQQNSHETSVANIQSC